MNITQYAEAKESILRRMLNALIKLFRRHLTPEMTRTRWEALMRLTYRVMKPYRDEATTLAREFYDDNRAAQTGDDTRHNIYKDDHYPLEWMEEALEPTLRDLQKTGNVDAAVVDISQRLTKVVEDGARRTILRGVETDVRMTVRWARFDPRPPTCAFCTMMISRGPVYQDAESAGFDRDDESAEEIMQNVDVTRVSKKDAEELSKLMNRWHPGCTCVAVPIYKFKGYPTQSQERDAMKLYEKARKRVKGKKTYKAILKEMRRLMYVPAEGQDEADIGAA